MVVVGYVSLRYWRDGLSLPSILPLLPLLMSTALPGRVVFPRRFIVATRLHSMSHRNILPA